MSQLLRRHTRVACFFCQTEATPRDPHSFLCQSCQCWNRYDAKGEIISEEPAMHDENLNARSFAKRASPRKDRLPSTFSNTLFCHTCQTNQMLASNILSNYLPSANHPEFETKLQTYDAYRESVELRYPQVCSNCLPAVEEEIRRRDTMARVNALGGILKKSKGKGKQRAGDVTQAQRDRLERSLFWWRLRGVLWVVTLVGTVLVYAAAALNYRLTRIPSFLGAPSLCWTICSILWAAWDPTYATKRRDELQGRQIRQVGKRQYNLLQTFAWLSRLVASILFTLSHYRPSHDYIRLHDPSSLIPRIYCFALLFLEVFVTISSVVVLQIRRTPTLHLIDTASRRPSSTPSLPSSRAGTPALDPSSSLSSLSLSHQTNPTSPLSNPIFGLPSFSTKSNAPDSSSNTDIYPIDDDYDDDHERDPNAMDWSPTVPSPAKTAQQERLRRDNNGFIMRPPKFYAPEEPTGLENLFETTIRLADGGDEPMDVGAKSRPSAKVPARSKSLLGRVVVVTAVLCGFAAAGAALWLQRDVWTRLSV